MAFYSWDGKVSFEYIELKNRTDTRTLSAKDLEGFKEQELKLYNYFNKLVAGLALTPDQYVFARLEKEFDFYLDDEELEDYITVPVLVELTVQCELTPEQEVILRLSFPELRPDNEFSLEDDF